MADGEVAGRGQLTFDSVREWATDRADDWYLADGEDHLTSDGLAAGRALRVEAFNVFLSLGLGVAGLASDVNRSGPRAWLKSRGLDRVVRSWSMRALSLGRQAEGAAGIIVVSEMATPSALGGMAAVASRAPSGALAAWVADPRALPYWRSRGIASRPLLVGIADQQRWLRRASRWARGAWAVIESRPPDLRLGNVDLAPLAMPALRRLVIGSAPWMHVERAAIREALRRAPRAVLVASDQHRIGCLVVEEARRVGVPTAVLQHGLPQHRVGYVPVAADRVLTWSHASSRWFVAHGTDPRRLVVVGNPAFDGLRRTGGDGEASSRPPMVLLALTPATSETNRAIVLAALDAIVVLRDVRLTVKLHPGDGEWSYVRELIARHPAAARVTVQHREPLQPLLQHASACWLHRSSVALGSLAVGVPVVVIATAAPSTADLELADLGLPIAGSASELAHLTRDLFYSAARAAYFSTRPIEDSVGPPDGQAAARVLQALDALSHAAGSVA